MTILQRLRERFWFVPAVMCLVASAMAELLVTLDQRYGGLAVPAWADPVFYRVGASGSRDVLGAIASSSLAVAGTTFSITMAVLALTSSTYGPRLIRNFMSDRGNQAVLGVFVATFLYSLLVLRSIRVVGDSGDDEFVPHLAVNAAVVLAVADVAVLIYFIHHISDSIQISTLTAGVREQLRATIERVYPSAPEDAAEQAHGAPADDAGPDDDLEAPPGGIPLRATGSGYLQFVEEDALVRHAARLDAVVALDVRPGQYVVEGSVLGRVRSASAVADAELAAIRRTLHLADTRTPHQDPEFAVQQLTEMAVRALSPGVNDPYTAENALDDLSSGLVLLATRTRPASARCDEHGVVRVYAPRPQPSELVRSVIDRMRWYGASAPSVMHAALEVVDRLAVRTSRHADKEHLMLQVALLEDAFGGAGHHPQDVRQFAVHADAVRRRLT